ncbi:hypothetical protein [Aquimarina agarilytica]|uniref:hypothetical protein n=1 Tax=Aquimarina agarilytica TaxID=1087449 RepID=UPI00028852A4|nr:hypothetical protein [Aquimarina agarilytica]
MKTQILLSVISLFCVLFSCNSPLEEENETDNENTDLVFNPIYTTNNKSESYIIKEEAEEKEQEFTIFASPVVVCDIEVLIQKFEVPELEAFKITGEVLENKSTDNNGGWFWALQSSKYGKLWSFDNSTNYAEMVIKKSDVEFFTKDDTDILKFSFDFFSKECFEDGATSISPHLEITIEDINPFEDPIIIP